MSPARKAAALALLIGPSVAVAAWALWASLQFFIEQLARFEP